MIRRDRDRLDALRRRRNHIAGRIRELKHVDTAWDRQELAALNWAIKVIEDADQSGALERLYAAERGEAWEPGTSATTSEDTGT